jgi:hypothetical protein
MAVFEIYSRRKAAASGVADVVQYDRIPDPLRVQAWNIIRRSLGRAEPMPYRSDNQELWNLLRETVAHEQGRPSLGRGSGSSPGDDVQYSITKEPNVDYWLDVIEVSLRLVERVIGGWSNEHRSSKGVEQSPDDAVAEMNERFRLAGLGYRYEDGVIIRLDSEFTHSEATIPALHLLSDAPFAGADEEFRAAHAHFRAGETKDAAVDALNAFESTMKAICDAKGWTYPKGARASDLLKILRRETLFPDFGEQSLEQLLATLKALSAVRNETGGHGQGAAPVEVPPYVAAYALNLAAAKIRFLVEAYHASER